MRGFMAAATAGYSSKKKRSSIRRILLCILLLIVGIFVIMFVGVYIWFCSAERAAMPTVDGTVKVAGLSAPVQVIRDHQGVPHITAASMDDLFLAQGYVTAQDRLWQMDTTRRYAAGELSEAFGGRMIETDKSQRLLGFPQLAHKQYAMMSTRDRSYFDAYARGVNAFIAEHRRALPLDFASYVILRARGRRKTLCSSEHLSSNLSRISLTCTSSNAKP